MGAALGYANYIEIVVTVLAILFYIYVFKADRSLNLGTNEVFAIAQEAEEKK